MIHLTGPPGVAQTTRRYRLTRRGCPSSAGSRPLLPVSPLNGGAPGIEGRVTSTGVARTPLSLAAAGEISGAGAVDSTMSSERTGDGAGAEGIARESSPVPEVEAGRRGPGCDGASCSRTFGARCSLGWSMAGTRRASLRGVGIRRLAAAGVGSIGADAIGAGAIGVGAVGVGVVGAGAGRFDSRRGPVTETLSLTAGLRRAE